MEVPTITLGLTPSSSKASSIGTWASPRAEPPPSARAMPCPSFCDFARASSMAHLLRGNGLIPVTWRQSTRAGHGTRWRQGDGLRDSCARQGVQRFGAKDALELAAQLL